MNRYVVDVGGLVPDAPCVPGGYLIIDGLGDDVKTAGRRDSPSRHGVHGRGRFGVVSVDKVSRGRGEGPFGLLDDFPRYALAHGVHDGGSVGVPPIDQSAGDIGPVAEPPFPREGIDGIEAEGNLEGGIRDEVEGSDEIIPVEGIIPVPVGETGVIECQARIERNFSLIVRNRKADGYFPRRIGPPEIIEFV